MTLLLFIVLTSYNSDTEVFICDSKTAKKYHYDENCRGLGSCKHDIKRVKLSEAEKTGRTLCGWEK